MDDFNNSPNNINLYPNHQEIKTKLTDYLKSKGFGIYKYISLDVFLSNKYQLLKKQDIDLADKLINEIFDTLRYRNEMTNYNSNNSMTDITVICRTFIDYFTDEFLFDFKRKVKQQEDYIKEYKITTTLNQMAQIFPLLKNPTNNNNQQETSILKATLCELNYFPKDNYVISLIIINSDGTKDSYPITIGKHLINDNRKLNAGFPEVTFGTYVTPGGDDNDMSNEYQPLEHFSGCTLNKFYFEIQKNGKPFMMTEERFFFFQFLNYTDDLMNIDNKSLTISIKSENPHSKEMSLLCSFEFFFDNFTRLNILEEIAELYKTTIREKNNYSSAVKALLNCYFREISDPIQSLLKEETRNERACCNECIII